LSKSLSRNSDIQATSSQRHEIQILKLSRINESSPFFRVASLTKFTGNIKKERRHIISAGEGLLTIGRKNHIQNGVNVPAKDLQKGPGSAVEASQSAVNRRRQQYLPSFVKQNASDSFLIELGTRQTLHASCSCTQRGLPSELTSKTRTL
jgi:hypothetical protein